MSPETRVAADDIGELVRTTPPPPGFEAFAVAIATVAQAPERVFGVAVDPMRPAEIISPANAGQPPHCPACFSLLQPVVANAQGDTLFDCLYDGYETVYRKGTAVWEPRPRPGMAPESWKPPMFGEVPETAKPGPSTPTAVQAPPVATPTGESPAVVPAAPPAPVVRTPLPPRPAPASPPPAEDEEVDWLTWADAAAISGQPVDELYKVVRKQNVPRRKDARGRVLVNMDALLKVLGSDG